MSSKKRPRQKEKSAEDDGGEGNSTWECTVCTYRNRFEAFKCEMCDTRKGTSTRKPRLNQEVQQMHSAVHNLVLQHHQKIPGQTRRKAQVSGGSPSNSRHSPESTSSGSLSKNAITPSTSSVNKRKPIPIKDQLISRATPKKLTVLAKGVPHVITEFKPK